MAELGALPPVFVEFIGKSRGVKLALGEVKAELDTAGKEGAGSFSTFGRAASAAVTGVAIAAVGAGIASVKAAADFQTQMTRVRTGAGEAAGNMQLVSQGVLAMAGQVGQSTSDLTAGLYQVESASFHGTDALNVLRISAMGAKVGAADLATVTDAVTTAMNAYSLKTKDVAKTQQNATDVMNALVGTEAEGKTNMEALAGSMATVLPAASAAHVGLKEVLGAMATMTAQGTPAADTATYLRQTILQLENPSGVAQKALKAVGLTGKEVSDELGHKGLAATLTMLTTAIHQHGAAGKTYIGQLAAMVGGTKSMQAALELTGAHMKDFTANTDGVADHVRRGGKNIEGWADVQQNFNQKLAEAKAGFGAMVIQIGQYLLPYATKAMGMMAQFTTWLTKNKGAAEALAGVIGAALAAGALKAAVAGFKPLISVMNGSVQAAKTAKDGLSMLRQGFNDARVAQSAFSGPMGSLGGKLKTATTTVQNLASAGWSKIAQGASGAAGKVGELASAGWSKIASGASSAGSALADAAAATGRWVVQAAASTAAALRQAAAWAVQKAALIASAVAEKAAAAAQWLLDAAMDANPITLIVLALAALVAALIYAYKHVAWVRDLVNGAFKLIAQGVGWLVGFVRAHWPLLLAIITGPIGMAVYLITHYWTQIKHGFADAWHFLVSSGENAARWLMALPGRILGWFNSANTWLLNAGRDIIRGLWHGIQEMGSWISSQITGFIKDVVPGPVLSVLGIHSPSRVFMEIGRHVTTGLALGITGNADQAAHASAAMAAKVADAAQQRAVPAPRLGFPATPGHQTGTGYGGGQATQVAEVTTIVQVDGEELFRLLQPHALRYDRRNPRAGLVYVR